VGSLAVELAGWAHGLRPEAADDRLADRALLDVLAVALAGRRHPVARLAAELPPAVRWAVAGHVLDFDDLHLPSTSHVSVVCVPAVLATGGGRRAYLAAAGVMARLGTVLGWPHYSAGWHATCTAGAPAAAVGAAVALGLGVQATAAAIALAVPGAGGVQRAFGTAGKSLQVGFAVDAGLRAARLAAAGADADPGALDDWVGLVGGDAGRLDLGGPAIPGGLATKIYPCCYALQRPIAAIQELTGPAFDPAAVRRVVLRTPAGTVAPLLQHRPETGLQGKFSLAYAAAATILDGHPGLASFTDAAVRRPAARRLVDQVTIELTPGGEGLLDGELQAELELADGTARQTTLRYPPGSPANPPSPALLHRKLLDCTSDLNLDPATWTWATAADLLRTYC
jgi:2-methylcitrate dehydratase PrpD